MYVCMYWIFSMNIIIINVKNIYFPLMTTEKDKKNRERQKIVVPFSNNNNDNKFIKTIFKMQLK